MKAKINTSGISTAVRKYATPTNRNARRLLFRLIPAVPFAARWIEGTYTPQVRAAPAINRATINGLDMGEGTGRELCGPGW